LVVDIVELQNFQIFLYINILFHFNFFAYIFKWKVKLDLPNNISIKTTNI